MSAGAQRPLRYTGCTHLRARLVCSTLSGRPVRIDDIRPDDRNPGMRDFEASLLRLLEKLTNGCKIEINETGTSLYYRPGVLAFGEEEVVHDCGTSRGIGYFLEAVVCLAPFGKRALALKLRGVTNDEADQSVDGFRNVTMRLLKHFGIDEGVALKVKKRGAPPLGGGEVLFGCPCVRELKPVNLVNEGLVKRVRGIAYSTRVSPQLVNRIVDKSRGELNNFLPDVYVYTDHYTGSESGLSPGYGLSLVAETTTGALISAEVVARDGAAPEEVGTDAARLLLEEIKHGGCVDSTNQSLVLLLMVLCPEDVSRVRLGKLSQYTVVFLRHIRDFFGVVFHLQEDPDTVTPTVLATCRGLGFTNLARKTV